MEFFGSLRLVFNKLMFKKFQIVYINDFQLYMNHE
jgi:hypothetical protein